MTKIDADTYAHQADAIVRAIACGDTDHFTSSVEGSIRMLRQRVEEYKWEVAVQSAAKEETPS